MKPHRKQAEEILVKQIFPNTQRITLEGINYEYKVNPARHRAIIDAILEFASSQQVSREKIIEGLSKISVDKANAEYIAKTGVINGTLLVQLTELLSALADTGGEDKVTDEMIEKWAINEANMYIPETKNEGDLQRWRDFHYASLHAAKAMRDGKINPAKENNQ